MKKVIIPFLAVLFLSVSVHAQKQKDELKNKGGVIKEKHKGTVTPVVTPVVTHTAVTTTTMVVHKPVTHTIVHHPVHHTTVHHPVHHTTVHHPAPRPVVHKTVVKPVVKPVVIAPVVTTGKTKMVSKPKKTVIKGNGIKTTEVHKKNKTKTRTKKL